MRFEQAMDRLFSLADRQREWALNVGFGKVPTIYSPQAGDNLAIDYVERMGKLDPAKLDQLLDLVDAVLTARRYLKEDKDQLCKASAELHDFWTQEVIRG
jgi:hypothetical protein